MFMVDVLPDFPIPVGQRENIAELTMPVLVWNIARDAEERVSDKDKFLREEH